MGESGDYLASYIQMTWLCGELEEDLKAMVGWFIEVCGGRGTKVNAAKSRVMILN